VGEDPDLGIASRLVWLELVASGDWVRWGEALRCGDDAGDLRGAVVDRLVVAGEVRLDIIGCLSGDWVRWGEALRCGDDAGDLRGAVVPAVFGLIMPDSLVLGVPYMPVD